MSVAPAMPDRLQELLRQRALLEEHLAWLDREIAAESEQRRSPGPVRLPALPAPPPPAAPDGGYLASQTATILGRASAATPPITTAADQESPLVAATADAIMSEYRVQPDTLKTDIRKGCFVYFFVALVLLAAGVAILYILIPSTPAPH